MWPRDATSARHDNGKESIAAIDDGGGNGTKTGQGKKNEVERERETEPSEHVRVKTCP